MSYTSIVINTGEANIGDLVGFNIPSTVGYIEKDKIYTLQFKCRALSNSYLLDGIYVGNQKLSNIDIKSFDSVFIENVEFKLCHTTFTSDSKVLNPSIKICKSMVDTDINNKDIFEITDISLAYGNLSKYDVNVGDFMLLRKELNTKLQQLSDMILLSSNSETIDELTGKVNKALGQIQVSAGNIALKVDNDGIISAINMSKEGIKIDTNLLDLTGDLDLQGKFKCYKSNSNKTSDYLHMEGALVKGYNKTGGSNPVFASGLWTDENRGYFSVGYTNALNSDENGCLWLSSQGDNNGGELTFSKKVGNDVKYTNIYFNKNGSIDFKTDMYGANDNDDTYTYRFDSGVSTKALRCNNIRTYEIYPRTNGSCDIGSANMRYKDIYADSLSTTNNQLRLGTVTSVGAWQTYGALAINSRDGYVYPEKGNGQLSLGMADARFYRLYAVTAVDVSSDERCKSDIHYLEDLYEPNILGNRVDINMNITTKDMYEFIKDDLKLASYRCNVNLERGNTSVDYGFIAQDVLYTKVGSEIVQLEDKNNLYSNLSYNQGNYISTIAGALQEAIKEIENLKEEIKILKGGA